MIAAGYTMDLHNYDHTNVNMLQRQNLARIKRLVARGSENFFLLSESRTPRNDSARRQNAHMTAISHWEYNNEAHNAGNSRRRSSDEQLLARGWKTLSSSTNDEVK